MKPILTNAKNIYAHTPFQIGLSISTKITTRLRNLRIKRIRFWFLKMILEQNFTAHKLHDLTSFTFKFCLLHK